MKLKTHAEQDKLVIALKGELDSQGAADLDKSLQTLVSESKLSVCIDCRELSNISPAGIGIILSYRYELNARGIPLVLFGLDTPLENIFAVMGLHVIIPIVSDKTAAGLFCDVWCKVYTS